MTKCENMFDSKFTWSGGSRCFQPVQTPCTEQAAALGVDRWCLLASTAEWRTPSCQQIPRYHWLVLPGWNPGWWEFDVLHKRQKNQHTFGQSSAGDNYQLSSLYFLFTHAVGWMLLYCLYNYLNWQGWFSSDSLGLASAKCKTRKNLHVNIL